MFRENCVVVHGLHCQYGTKRRFVAMRSAALEMLRILGSEYPGLHLTVEGDDSPVALQPEGEPFRSGQQLAEAVVGALKPEPPSYEVTGAGRIRRLR